MAEDFGITNVAVPGSTLRDVVERAARMLNATPADIPGLWNVPGYPELTTGQLLSVAREMG